MKHVLLFSFIVLALNALCQPREIVFQLVKFSDEEPVLDGVLEDMAWRNATIHTSYYEYGRSNPGISPLKTELRILYGERGLFIGIVNFEEKMDCLRRAVTEFDNVDIWKDDCAELYIDTEANGISYTKFTVNANGARSDYRRMDTAVSSGVWDGSGWTAAAHCEKDRWCLEVFIPWQDLGRRARAGEIWQCLHNRYCWTSGKFCGASSSPEGSYNRTDCFGYLYFCRPGEGGPSPEELVRLASRHVAPPWYLSSEKKILLCGTDGIKVTPIKSLLCEKRNECLELLQDCQHLGAHESGGELLQFQKELASVEGEEAKDWKQLCLLQERLFDVKWRLLLKRDFE